jgi:hypothetical protein
MRLDIFKSSFDTARWAMTTMNALQSSLKKPHEGLKNYLILACYLWVVFALFVSYRSVILSEHRILFAPHGLALVNALVLAKVMLVAQKFVDQWFNEIPLLYTTLCKSAAYAVLLGWLKTVEETAVGLWRGFSGKESIVLAIGHRTLTGTSLLMAMLAVVLIPFFAFTELSRVLGEEERRHSCSDPTMPPIRWNARPWPTMKPPRLIGCESTLSSNLRKIPL